MRELGRIFTGRRVLAAVFIVLLNLGMYLRQQQMSGFGFSPEVDSAEANAVYGELLEEYREKAPETALPALQRQTGLTQVYKDITYILMYREQYCVPEDEARYAIWEKYYEEEYEALRQTYPELMESVASGEADEAAIAAKSAAAEKLAGQLGHIAGFDDYLRSVEERAKQLGTFTIFAKPGSFAARNIEKTARDFARLDGIDLSVGRDDAVISFFSYGLMDWFLVLLMVLAAMSFLDERQTGLWNTVYASPGGRERLALKRVGALALAALLATAALYGTVLLAGFAIYGGAGELGRAAQSVELLGLLPVRATLGGVLARFFLLRVLTAFTVGLFLWLLLSAANTSVRWMIVGTAAFFSVEYYLYTFLPDQSILQVLKYLNIFSYVDLATLYTKYLNLNIFGRPVNIRALVAVSCGPLALMLGGGCVALQRHMRPRLTRTPFAGIGRILGGGLDRLRSCLSLTGFECRKLFITQGGALILAAFVWLASGMDYQVHISRTEADDLSLELQGEITDATLEALETMDDAIDQVFATSQEYQKMVDEGIMDFETLYDFNLKYSNTQAEQVGLHTVMSKVDRLLEESERLGARLWLLDELPFRNIYGSEADGIRISLNLLTLLILSLLLAGFISMEQTSTGLQHIIHASPRGRMSLLGRKYVLAAVSTVLLWAVPTFFEIKTLLSSIDHATLSAPIQSLTFLEKFTWTIPIGTYLAILYLGRLLSLLSCAFITLWLSSLSRKPQYACLIVCVILVVPTLLWNYLNMDLLRSLSVARLTDMEALIASHVGEPQSAIFSVCILFILGAACAALTFRRWRKTP